MRLVWALAALSLCAGPSRAQWRGTRFRYDEKTGAWTLPGGRTDQDYNLYNPVNNLVAHFDSKGELQALFDSYPDHGPAHRPDDIYLVRPAGSLAVFSLRVSSAARLQPASQSFEDGVRTIRRRSRDLSARWTQFMPFASSDMRALAEELRVTNTAASAKVVTLRAVVRPCLAFADFSYFDAAFSPACRGAARFDPALGAVVARDPQGIMFLVAGLAVAPRPAVFAAGPSGSFQSVARLALGPGRSAEISFVVGVGSTAAAAQEAYARLRAGGEAGVRLSAERTAQAWQSLRERAAFRTGSPAVDSLNDLKYILNSDYAAENGGLTAAKFGHPEIWARDSGYGSLAAAIVAPGRARQTLSSALAGGFVAGQDGVSMLTIASEHYARIAGDRRFLKAHLPDLERRMQRMWRSRNAQGFLVDRGGGLDTWRDWPSLQAVLKGKANVYQQVIFAAALDRLGRMFADLGNAAQAALWKRRAAAMRARINRSVPAGGFWLPAKGSYADYIDPKARGAFSAHVDEVGTGLGVLFGVFPRGRWNVVLRSADAALAAASGLGHQDSQPYGAKPVFNDGDIWPFANFLEAAAQASAGRGGDFLRLAGDMSTLLSVSPGSLPESVSQSQKDGPISIVSTLWNSAGLYAVVREVFGVKEDGFAKTVTLSPRLPSQWLTPGRALSLTGLPFQGWLVSVVYRVMSRGRLAVSVRGRPAPGSSAPAFSRRFTMRTGAAKTLRLP